MAGPGMAFAVTRSWRFVVPSPDGEQAFAVTHVPDHERRVVEVIGLGRIDPEGADPGA
ncbi:MAG: hypothetical protein HYY16_14755 [Planctomycetes bacterium]|nr:hypothetical protein [Planctomycetota bacterium]